MENFDTGERAKLEHSAKMHGIHWLAVGFSLLLTIAAFLFAKHQLQERVSRQFDREAEQVVELIFERMKHYEDALWGGVALANTVEGDIQYDQWLAYSNSIHIEDKYPGINGIGVIHALEPQEISEYLSLQKSQRPDFHIHPTHDNEVLYPISFVEPLETNKEAIGLDMGHERNRLAATLLARDTGDAQVTGPIVLVQDSGKTPGFLFFAPFYKDGDASTLDIRKDSFQGMVYAPIVVKNLMKGVLDKANRQVGVRLADGDETLYDELLTAESDFDSDPLYTKQTIVSAYGRTWVFDVWSAKSFREAQSSAQPKIILAGGLLIDILLVILFITLTSGNRRALTLVDIATSELKDRNNELEQFVYTASHDLKSPLLTIQGFAGFLKRDVDAGRMDRIGDFLNRIIDGTNRMYSNIDDLLELSRIGRALGEKRLVDVQSMASGLALEMSSQVDENDVQITVQEQIPQMYCDSGRLYQVIENLISNAIKYGRVDGKKLKIHIRGEHRKNQVCLFVSDNGPGIPTEYREKVFGLFQRLDSTAEGTGIGLAIVSRVAQVHGGSAWIEPTLGGGATLVVSFPAYD